MNLSDHRIDSPYVGPRPFEREDIDRFFGRTQETSQIVSLIIANPEVLIYAPSGAGKTSLLNAAVIPSLESAPCEVFRRVRFRGYVEQSDLDSIPNIFVFHALMSWAFPDDRRVDRFHLAGNSIPEFMHSRPLQTDDYGSPIRRVVIFDQFEEFFSLYPDRWRDRHDFFAQLHSALEADPYLRLVLVMREESIAALDPFAPLLPDRLRTRFRLDLLREKNALAAIEQPFLATGRHFANGVAEDLVRNLRSIHIQTASGETKVVPGEFIAPVQLQVVCQSLWEEVPLEITEIRRDHLRAFGDVGGALEQYYDRAIRTVVEKTDMSEGIVRRWFENTLITPAGTRGLALAGQGETATIPTAALESLEQAHVIRTEMRGGSYWYELVHDRFIGPIQKSNSRWLAPLYEAEPVRQRLEERASVAGALLDELELRDAEEFLNSPAASKLGISPAARSYVRASRTNIEARGEEMRAQAEYERAKAQRIARRMLYFGIGLGILISAIFIIIFWMISGG